MATVGRSARAIAKLTAVVMAQELAAVVGHRRTEAIERTPAPVAANGNAGNKTAESAEDKLAEAVADAILARTPVTCHDTAPVAKATVHAVVQDTDATLRPSRQTAVLQNDDLQGRVSASAGERGSAPASATGPEPLRGIGLGRSSVAEQPCPRRAASAPRARPTIGSL